MALGSNIDMINYAIHLHANIMEAAHAYASRPMTEIQHKKKLGKDDKMFLAHYVSMVEAAQGHVLRLRRSARELQLREQDYYHHGEVMHAEKCSKMRKSLIRAADAIEEPYDEKLGYISALQLTCPSSKPEMLEALQRNHLRLTESAAEAATI